MVIKKETSTLFVYTQGSSNGSRGPSIILPVSQLITDYASTRKRNKTANHKIDN